MHAQSDKEKHSRGCAPDARETHGRPGFGVAEVGRDAGRRRHDWNVVVRAHFSFNRLPELYKARARSSPYAQNPAIKEHYGETINSSANGGQGGVCGT